MKRKDIEEMKEAWKKRIGKIHDGEPVVIEDITSWLSAIPLDVDELIRESRREERERCAKICEELLKNDYNDRISVMALQDAVDKIGG